MRSKNGNVHVVKAPVDPWDVLTDEESPHPGPTTTSIRPDGESKTSKWFRRTQFLGGIGVVVVMSILVAWGARRYLLTSPRFAVRSVLVDGAHKKTADEIANLAGISVGKNVFSLDLDWSAASVMTDPWIEKATVVRTLPSTIKINVVERQAYALIVLTDQNYLVTQDGEIFKEITMDDETDLPMITGISVEQVEQDRKSAQERALRAIELIDMLSRSSVSKQYPIQEIHIDKDNALVATLGKNGFSVHFGQPPYREKIEQLHRVLIELSRRKAKPAIVFTDNTAHSERVIVRLQ